MIFVILNITCRRYRDCLLMIPKNEISLKLLFLKLPSAANVIPEILSLVKIAAVVVQHDFDQRERKELVKLNSLVNPLFMDLTCQGEKYC